MERCNFQCREVVVDDEVINNFLLNDKASFRDDICIKCSQCMQQYAQQVAIGDQGRASTADGGVGCYW